MNKTKLCFQLTVVRGSLNFFFKHYYFQGGYVFQMLLNFWHFDIDNLTESSLCGLVSIETGVI